MVNESMEQELVRLRAENERLKSKTFKTISFKVSQKGALSVYGMGRFPVSLYKEQWVRLLDKKDEILQFIKENENQLATKS
jgi:hypothetical protein